MRTFIAAFFMALVVAGCLTPLVSWLARRLGATSQPGGRHVNNLAIPRLGGLALAVATLSPLATLFFVDSEVARIVRDWKTAAFALVAGPMFMCLVGAWDDVRGLRPWTKLIAQLAAAIFAYAWGFRIDGLLIPLIGPIALGAFAPIATVVWIVGITNAVNLIDGLDGLAAGVVFFAAATNLIVALVSGPKFGGIFVCLLMASLMGALLGFLFYNFNPARIFMGDSGSYFLGYTLALTSLLSPIQKASTAVSLVIPVLALGLPIFDTLLSIARRYLEHRPVFSADRGHIHHRLLDMGLTHRRTVVTLYGITFMLAGLAIITTIERAWVAGFAVLGASAILFGLVRFLGYFESSQQAVRLSSHTYDLLTDQLRRLLPSLVVQLYNSTDAATFTHAIARVLGAPGVLSVRGVARGTTQFEVNALEAQRNIESAKGPHLERFHFASGSFVVELGVERRRFITPASLALLQVFADVVFDAATKIQIPTPQAAANDSPVHFGRGFSDR